MVMIVGNAVGLTGRIVNEEIKFRNQGRQLRDQLIISLMNHDIHRARKEERVEDEYKYMTRNQTSNLY